MNWLMSVVVIVQILAALVMIGLVLIQHGKGADMGASFGSGSSGSLFGASGSANFLSRSTAVCAAVFFACTLGLAFMANDRTAVPSDGGSILDRPAAETAPPTGAALIPDSGASAVAPSVTPAAPVAPPASGAAAIPTQ